MVGKNTLIFLIITIVVVGIFAYIVDRKTPNKVKILRQTLGCTTETISDSVLNLDSHTTLIGAYISFDAPVDDKMRQKFDDLQVILDEDSWIFGDSVYAEIPTRSMCDLAKVKGIRLIYIPENNSQAWSLETSNEPE